MCWSRWLKQSGGGCSHPAERLLTSAHGRDSFWKYLKSPPPSRLSPPHEVKNWTNTGHLCSPWNSVHFRLWCLRLKVLEGLGPSRISVTRNCFMLLAQAWGGRAYTLNFCRTDCISHTSSLSKICLLFCSLAHLGVFWCGLSANTRWIYFFPMH